MLSILKRTIFHQGRFRNATACYPNNLSSLFSMLDPVAESKLEFFLSDSRFYPLSMQSKYLKGRVLQSLSSIGLSYFSMKKSLHNLFQRASLYLNEKTSEILSNQISHKDINRPL